MVDLARPEAPPLEPPQHGIVKTAPAAMGEPFTVSVPDFSGEHVVEIARWATRGNLLPAVGDEVVVLKDERGEAWVPVWWPAAGDVPNASVATTKGCVVEAVEDPFTIASKFTKPRPVGHPSVEWVCLFEPVNAIDGDTWVNPGRP